MKKTLVYILIVIILLFVGYLSYYKFLMPKKSKNVINNKIELGEYKYQNYDINYVEEYNDNIMYSMISEVNFYIIDESNSGKLYIDGNKKLNLVIGSTSKKILEDLKFNTLYSDISTILNAYAISEDGKLYRFLLTENDADKLKTEEIEFDAEIMNFTNLKIKSYMNVDNNSLVVLASNGKMYDVYTMSLYNDKTIRINDEYLLYEDMTISNNDGKIIVLNGNNIKVKNILLINETGIFEKNPTSIIVTDNNKIIYVIGNKVYEYNKEVLNISKNNNKLVITFTDKSKIEINGIYDEELFDNK